MRDFITQLDQSTQTLMQDISHPVLDQIFLWITKVADPIPMIILSAALIVYLAVRKEWRQMFTADIALLSGLFLQFVLKLVFGRSRPEGGLVEETTFSFPSGHSTMSMIFFLLLLLCVNDDMKKGPLKTLLQVISIAGILLVPISRIYLQVHWLSDIIAGALLGIVVVFASWKIGQKMVERK